VDALPSVRFELRLGSARPALHDMADAGFLVGSVPGCDLRLPGASLPPVLCLITRQPAGVLLRKLAPAQPVFVNGRPVTSADLQNGDRVTLGAVDLLVHIDGGTSVTAAVAAPAIDPSAIQEQLDRQREEIAEQARELQADRVLWYRRREEIEQECRRQMETAATLGRQVEERQRDQAAARDTVAEQCRQLAEQKQALAERAVIVQQQERELEASRQHFHNVRQQLYDRYRQRRDRLAGLQEAVSRAARKVQEQKQAAAIEMPALAARRTELDTRQAELDAQAADLAQARKDLDEERAWCHQQRQEYGRAIDDRLTELQARDQKLAEERTLLERGQAQYQADLVRLDRLAARLDQRQHELDERASAIESRAAVLHQDLAELEEQARALDAAHEQLAAESEALDQRRAEVDRLVSDAGQRAAALEGQQAMLATLRGRLDRMRDDARREAQELAEQRSRQAAVEEDLQQRLLEVQRVRGELDRERQAHAEQLRLFQERGSSMESAVTNMRRVQEEAAAQQAELDRRLADCDARAAEQLEQLALVQARGEQLAEQQRRLEADRQALREREANLARTEQTREALQEQLRRRSEELAQRQRALAEQERKHTETATALQAQQEAIIARQAELDHLQQAGTQQLAGRIEEVERRHAEVAASDRHVQSSQKKLQEMGRAIAADRKALSTARQQLESDRAALAVASQQREAELGAAAQELLRMQRQFPELEARAGEAVERLTVARQRLSEHLAEIHSYAQQGHAGLEVLRGQLQAQADDVRQQTLALHQAREEHRLAVATFRQQIIDWQAQVADMKRALARGENRLEKRQAEVEEQARAIDANAAELARQAQELDQRQRQVNERRAEIERHLEDMRQWYRRKLRELAAGQESRVRNAETGVRSPEAEADGRDILSLTEDDMSAGDRQLGELLHSLGLVEPEPLNALLVEARRQRRSLRQMLLSGGYLTLYQLALIEAGNLDALVLGPTRVVDRIRSTAKEAVYRVFDPRRGREVVLRWLSESEAQDAVHPDEFRQRFGAAALVQHPHLAATLEVLDIGGRPAVLQEWLRGLPSSEWPALAAVPGAWYRLFSQAALALHTIHQAGLLHGRLGAESLLLTAEGTLKLAGVGEPAWLLDEAGEAPAEEESVAADLAALGTVALGWLALGPKTGKKSRKLSEALEAILERLTAADERRYASAGALLEDLDQAGAEVPPNAEAWDRLLRHVRDTLRAETPLRQSA